MPSTRPEKQRIVLATVGSLGDVFPFLAIANELRAHGYHPIVATSELYRGLVEANDLPFAPMRPDRFPGQKDPDFLDRLLRHRRAPGAIFREMFLPSPREALQDALIASEGADAIVSHTLAGGARLAAEVRGLPWISAVMQPMGYLSVHEPPVLGPDWIAATLRATGPATTRRVFALAKRITNSWAREWHDLRDELGLPPTSYHPLWEGQHSPLLSLGLFPRALGTPMPDWPKTARVTGFPFLALSDEVLDPALEQFLAAGEPPLVFTLGTTAVNEPGPFHRESAAAARRLGRRAVLLVGPGNQDFGQTPSSDSIAVPYAPHHLLFPHALAVIHQGGIGTLAEALRAGKPMLIMPYAHDQADNAWRAARLGVARVITRRDYNADIVAAELARLIGSLSVRAAASSVSEVVSRERGAAEAADLIEAALR
jgi:UDP:flavonoid glycosyltransferase YjiC (YdhE family)